MKFISKRINKICLAVLGFSLSLGTALCCLPTKTVGIARAQSENAEAHRFFHSAMQGEWESFTDKTALDPARPTYRGIRTEVRPAGGETDVTLTFNGIINPFTNNNFYFEHLSNDLGADYNAVVMTYTSAKDSTKQVSFVAMNRSESTYFTVSLTDDLEFDFDKGYAYIAGTNMRQPTYGLNRSSSVYEKGGLTQNTVSKKWGPIWGGDLTYSLNNEGAVRPNTGLVCANITDSEYLKLSSEFLTGEYAERYTSDYAVEILSAITDSIFTIRFCDIQKSEFAFHQRILNGTYMSETTEVAPQPRSTKPYLVQNSPVLYAGETYKVSELVTRYSAYWVDGEDVSYMNFFAGTDTWNDYSAKFGRLGHGTDNTGNVNNQDVTISGLVAGEEYPIIFSSYVRSGYGQYEGLWGCTQVLTWKVVEKKPTVESLQGVYFVRGVEYDLSKFFTVTPFEGEATCVYSVDNKAVSDGKYIFQDGNDHKISVVVTDDVGSAMASFTISEGKIVLPTERSIVMREGNVAFLAVPSIPAGMKYTVSTLVGEKVENSSAIVFPMDGEYLSKYVFSIPFTDQTLEKTVVNTVRIHEELSLHVNGGFKESYHVGDTLYLPSATIAALPSLQVQRQVFADGVELITENELAYKLEIAGKYVVKYFVTVENETFEKEYAFSVLRADERGDTVENPEENQGAVSGCNGCNGCNSSIGGVFIGIPVGLAAFGLCIFKKKGKENGNEEN